MNLYDMESPKQHVDGTGYFAMCHETKAPKIFIFEIIIGTLLLVIITKEKCSVVVLNVYFAPDMSET